ncbi:hypothetical protein GCM10027089_15220 [Nocardia thraciensis]
MRTIGYCEKCRKVTTVTIPAQNLILNRLIGVCDDCTTPAPRTRRSGRDSHSTNRIRHTRTGKERSS